MNDIKTFLANLSHHPGVYLMLGEKGDVLYVGKAKDLKKRIASYFSNKAQDLKTTLLVKQITDIDFTITANESEAVLLECNLIKKYKPRYNVLLRDDKSYPYILITTQHPYPRIDIYRGPRKKNALYFGPYPSAYAVRDTINLLQKIFRIRTCRDSYFTGRSRPCLLHQINRCTAPCVKFITQEDYALDVDLAIKFLEGKSNQVINELQKKMEQASTELDFELAVQYRDQINRMRQIQDHPSQDSSNDNADIIGLAIQAGVVCIHLQSMRNGQILGSRSYFPTIPKHATTAEVISAFISQHYFSHPSHIESIPNTILVAEEILDKKLLEKVLAEHAKHKVEILMPSRGEKKKWLETSLQSAKQALAAHLFTKINIQERGLSLQKFLNLTHLPKRIECFDISHIMGEATVASCVVFDTNGPIKSDYRRFNIIDITPGDDIAAMHQVLTRRFKRLQKEAVLMPEIVFIDGGANQLAAANSVLQSLNIQEVMLVGISKGPDRKAGFETLHFLHRPPLHLESDSIALHFIQQIRDEAHRFAITGHRNRRDKIRRHSSLELIAGIGMKRRRDLLRYFGGIQGISRASLVELIKVPGISRSLAERIFAALHDATL